MARSTGKVKWFSQEKGYGFIQQDSGPDVFVHHSQIQSKGFRTLNEGERVEFDVIEEPKGLKAQNVVRLDEAAGGSGAGSSAGGGGRRSFEERGAGRDDY
jgi:cold shock protein